MNKKLKPEPADEVAVEQVTEPAPKQEPVVDPVTEQPEPDKTVKGAEHGVEPMPEPEKDVEEDKAEYKVDPETVEDEIKEDALADELTDEQKAMKELDDARADMARVQERVRKASVAVDKIILEKMDKNRSSLAEAVQAYQKSQQQQRAEEVQIRRAVLKKIKDDTKNVR